MSFEIKKLDSYVERKILIGMIIDGGFLGKIKPIFKPEYLSTGFSKTVARWCLDYHQKYNDSPGKYIEDIYVTAQREKSIPEQDLLLISEFLEFISDQYEKEKFNRDFVLSETVKYFNERKLEIFYDDLTTFKDSKNSEEVLKLISSFEPINKELNLESGLFSETDKLVLPFNEFSKLSIPERNYLVYPWLREQEIVLLSGSPGIGKSFLCMELAGIASDGRYGMDNLWNSYNKVNVLYIDGELPLSDLQERGRITGLDGSDCDLLSRCMFETKDIPFNLANKNTREMLAKYILKGNNKGKYQLVIMDNLFSLFEGIDLIKPDDWVPVNSWLISLRNKGVSIILVHHVNKEGLKQFGTVTKEFNIDTNLVLKDTKQPGDDHLSFTVKIEKYRGMGSNLQGKKYKFIDSEWIVDEVSSKGKDDIIFKVMKWLTEGKKQVDIVKETGKSKQYINNIKRTVIDKEYLFREGDVFSYTPKGEEYINDISKHIYE